MRRRQAGRNRSKVLGCKRGAEAFDAEITRRKRTGELARLDAGKEPSSAIATTGFAACGCPARATTEPESTDGR